MWRECWVVRQARRRASRGWDEHAAAGFATVDEDGEGEGPMPARRVSWREGTDGAEVESWLCVKVVGWFFGGVIRRDYSGVSLCVAGGSADSCGQSGRIGPCHF